MRTPAPWPFHPGDVPASEGLDKVATALHRFELVEVTDRAAFELGYAILDRQFGATGEIEGYADIDGDGYGDAAGWTTGCDVVDNSLDCDDGDADAWPGAAEVPGDGVDQDCDGEDLAADTGGDSGGGGDSAADTDSAADSDSPSDSDSGGGADTADSGDDTTPPPDAETTGCGGGGEEKATGCGSRALLWLGPIGAASLLRRRRSSLRRSGSGR